MLDDFAKSELPDALRGIDISGFADLEPRDLILNPARLTADTSAAGRAIVYARSGDQATYDAIGFRAFAASPRRGTSPLQTSAWTAMQRDLTDRQKDATLVDEILHQGTKVLVADAHAGVSRLHILAFVFAGAAARFADLVDEL